MVRKISIVAAAALLSTAAFAQGPMQDTWDINAPNGAPTVPGKPLPAAASESTVVRGPMHDTWDINAPNGVPFARVETPTAASHGDPAVHGHAGTATRVDRVIEVGPGTRYVNVKSGEAVMFKVGNKSFIWTFDATVDHPTFDLSKIAPEGLVAQGVRIYCAPTEYERAG